jgi:hypothetical protein
VAAHSPVPVAARRAARAVSAIAAILGAGTTVNSHILK